MLSQYAMLRERPAFELGTFIVKACPVDPAHKYAGGVTARFAPLIALEVCRSGLQELGGSGRLVQGVMGVGAQQQGMLAQLIEQANKALGQMAGRSA